MNLLKFLLTGAFILGLSSPIYAYKKIEDRNFHASLGMELFTSFNNSAASEMLGDTNFLESLNGLVSVRIRKTSFGDFSFGYRSELSRYKSDNKEEGAQAPGLNIKSSHVFGELRIPPEKNDKLAIYLRGGPINWSVEATEGIYKKSRSEASIEKTYIGKSSGMRMEIGVCNRFDNGLDYCLGLSVDPIKVKLKDRQTGKILGDADLGRTALTVNIGY